MSADPPPSSLGFQNLGNAAHFLSGQVLASIKLALSGALPTRVIRRVSTLLSVLVVL